METSTSRQITSRRMMLGGMPVTYHTIAEGECTVIASRQGRAYGIAVIDEAGEARDYSGYRTQRDADRAALNILADYAHDYPAGAPTNPLRRLVEHVFGDRPHA